VAEKRLSNYHHFLLIPFDFLSKEHNHVMKESKTKTITSPPQYKTQAALTSRKNGAIKNSSSNGVLKLS
jgi:hypothetical protein